MLLTSEVKFFRNFRGAATESTDIRNDFVTVESVSGTYSNR